MALLRVGLKSAIAGGAIYYTIEQGVWKQSDATATLYGKIYQNVAPLVSSIKKDIPIEIPEPPKSEEVWFFFQNGWNKGVIATSMFIYKLPANVVQWSQCAVQMVNKQLQQVQDTEDTKPSNENKQ